MNIQHSIMIFFDSIYTPVVDKIVSLISYLGLGTVHIVFLLFIFWCMDKKKGFTICMTLVSVNSLANIVKTIVRAPRPWHILEDIKTQRDANATGYSFPSGHTAGATATFGSIAYVFRKRWLSILCALIIALVGFSRLYLCVHWPIDVAGGLLLGFFGVFVFNKIFMRLFDDKSLATKVFLVLGVLCTAGGFITGLMLNGGSYEEILLGDLSKALAITGGLSLGYVFEIHTSDFQIEEGHWGRKLARYLIGLVGVLFILPLSKIVLQKIGLYTPFSAQLRYFLTALWCAGIWPVLGKRFKLFV